MTTMTSTTATATAAVGPDRLLPAEYHTATEPDAAVQLRTGPASPDDYPAVSVPTLFRQKCERGADHVALSVKRDGEWQHWTYTQYRRDVERAARGLIALGLEPRHGVGIIGFNSPEWFMADMATVFAGGMAAGIYPTNNSAACRFIMEHCRANILIVEDESQLAKFLPFKQELRDLKAIVQYTGTPKEEGVLSWTQLLEKGDETDKERLEERLQGLAINECCHLVYTSGTTGQPKGVMLSHDNLTFTSRRLCEIFDMREKEERLVSYLPLSHVAANICDIFVMLSSVGTVTFGDKNALKGSLVKTLREAQPTLFFGVPRVWEKIHERMMEVGRQNKGFKQQLGNWAKRTGLEYNRNLMNGAASGATGTLKYQIANKVVFQKVKTLLGLNKCQRFYAAAAPLSREMLDYFLSLDIRILEIYGMSECSGPHLSNTYSMRKIGTIGKELAGFHNLLRGVESREDVRTDSETGGEICARGRHVMMGYLFNEQKTGEAIDADGWLHSGDLGCIDSDGFVLITGRIKELLITAGGENVPPVPIEDAIKRELPCVSHAMVIGDRRKFLSCLLTLKTEVDAETGAPLSTLNGTALEWCESVSGCKAKTVAEAEADERVRKAVQEGIDRVNGEATSNAQKVQKWVMLPTDFSVQGGELGPTMKVKRHVVSEKHEAIIENLYK